MYILTDYTNKSLTKDRPDLSAESVGGGGRGFRTGGLTPRLTGRLTVGRNVTSTSIKRADFETFGQNVRTVIEWVLLVEIIIICNGFILCRIWLG
jgi:hypothetical protein